MPTSTVIRIPEKTIPAQDLSITEFSWRLRGEVHVTLSDGSVHFVSEGQELTTFLESLYVQVASGLPSAQAVSNPVPLTP